MKIKMSVSVSKRNDISDIMIVENFNRWLLRSIKPAASDAMIISPVIFCAISSINITDAHMKRPLAPLTVSGVSGKILNIPAIITGYPGGK